MYVENYNRQPDQEALAFLGGGGEMGARLREHDWSGSPLGRPEQWPTSLQSTVSLMLNSGFPMFVAWGPELGFLYNDAYREILGTRHPQALGRRFQDIWEEIWPDLLPLIESALAGKATFRENLPLTMWRRGYEESTWFTFSYSPVYDENGEVRGMFCACTETTAQVLAERQRLDEVERLQQLFHQAPGFMAVLRGPNYVFELVNAAYQQLVGQRDYVGKPVREAIPDIEGQGFFELLDRVYASGEPFVGRGIAVKLQRQLGKPMEERFIDFIYQPLFDEHGKVVGIFVQGNDVTEQKRAEAALVQLNETLEERIAQAVAEREFAQEALRQAQKMEAIGHLTGGIAHDFNNLLQAVQGNLDLLRHFPQNPEQVRQWAEKALRNVQRGAKLTSQMLAFSRSQQLELRPVRIDESVRDMAEMLSRTLGSSIEVSLQLECPEVTAIADSTQLEMALLNLAINARDAMPQGGELHIATRTRQIHEGNAHLPPGDYVELSLSDTGIGMPPETQERAFDPFFTTKDVGKGTGLGLSQVYGFTRQAGGLTRIHSTLGRGTTVSLLLRCVQEKEVPPVGENAAAAINEANTDLKVLLVDDDEDVRKLLADMLGKLGCQVSEAADGPAALVLLEKMTPDLLLVDYAMPVMNGAEFVRAARRRLPQVPVVFSSGYADTAALHQAVGPEAIVLRKPFGLEELATVLSQATKAGQV